MALFIFTMKILATEMYEIKNGLSLLIVMELFEQRNEQHCDLKKNAQFTITPTRTGKVKVNDFMRFLIF